MTPANLRQACEQLAAWFSYKPSEQEAINHLIAFARQQQAVAWREAAKYIRSEAVRFDHIDDGKAHMIRAFATYCEAQAGKLEEGR